MTTFLVTFPAEHHTPDVVIDAEAYSQEFAAQLARHLHISEYTISLDNDCGWMTNRRTRASRHFTYTERASS